MRTPALCHVATLQDGQSVQCANMYDTACLLCSKLVCSAHTHYVRTSDRGVEDCVCDTCYATCMKAHEHKLGKNSKDVHPFTGRLLRIQSMRDSPEGINAIVTDAVTGEAIHGIFKAIITLDVKGTNQVILEYYHTNSDGRILCDDEREPLKGIATVSHVECDVTAYEVTHNAQELA